MNKKKSIILFVYVIDRKVDCDKIDIDSFNWTSKDCLDEKESFDIAASYLSKESCIVDDNHHQGLGSIGRGLSDRTQSIDRRSNSSSRKRDSSTLIIQTDVKVNQFFSVN